MTKLNAWKQMCMLKPDMMHWVSFDLDETLFETGPGPQFELLHPKKGAVEAVWAVAKLGYKPMVFSSRHWADHLYIENKLREYGFPKMRIELGKLLTLLHIDDRAYRFSSWRRDKRKIVNILKKHHEGMVQKKPSPGE